MTSGWCGEVGAGQQSCGSEDRRVSAGTWIQTGVTPAAGRGIAPSLKRGSPPAMAGTPAAGARRSACWPVSASCSKIRLRWRGSGLTKTRTTRSGDGASPVEWLRGKSKPGRRALPLAGKPLQPAAYKDIFISLWEHTLADAATLVGALRAAGEATRLRLLALLADGEHSVKDLTEILDQSQPRVSRHLKLLADAGLVTRNAEGAWAYYRLADSEAAAELARWLVARLD
eukprot:gene41666-55252_t